MPTYHYKFTGIVPEKIDDQTDPSDSWSYSGPNLSLEIDVAISDASTDAHDDLDRAMERLGYVPSAATPPPPTGQVLTSDGSGGILAATNVYAGNDGVPYLAIGTDPSTDGANLRLSPGFYGSFRSADLSTNYPLLLVDPFDVVYLGDYFGAYCSIGPYVALGAGGSDTVVVTTTETINYNQRLIMGAPGVASVLSADGTGVAPVVGDPDGSLQMQWGAYGASGGALFARLSSAWLPLASSDGAGTANLLLGDPANEGIAFYGPTDADPRTSLLAAGAEHFTARAGLMTSRGPLEINNAAGTATPAQSGQGVRLPRAGNFGIWGYDPSFDLAMLYLDNAQTIWMGGDFGQYFYVDLGLAVIGAGFSNQVAVGPSFVNMFAPLQLFSSVSPPTASTGELRFQSGGSAYALAADTISNARLFQFTTGDLALYGSGNYDSAYEGQNVSLVAALAGFAGGVGVLGLPTATTIPAGNPSSGFFVYVDPADNKLKVRGTAGTITTLANP